MHFKFVEYAGFAWTGFILPFSVDFNSTVSNSGFLRMFTSPGTAAKVAQIQNANTTIRVVRPRPRSNTSKTLARLRLTVYNF